MRQWCSVQLGTWHPYKQANTVIWCHWGPRIFAPLFNDLVNDANFKKKARPATLAKFLTCVRLAYPFFRAKLDAASAQVQRLNAGRVAVSHLRDLKKLLQFFIPVVTPHTSRNITKRHKHTVTTVSHPHNDMTHLLNGRHCSRRWSTLPP